MLSSHCCHEVIDFCQKSDKNSKWNWADEPEKYEHWNVYVVVRNVVPITKEGDGDRHKNHVESLQETEVLVVHEK